MSTTVKTQAQLDKALSNSAVTDIIIDSPRGVWLEISATGSATVSATGSATVSAYGSATVSAYGSATVRAYGSATVRAYDSATVRATGSATVSATDSATVSATDSATVSATDSATVSAYDSATVRAYDSATVSATGSATVRAYDSATVSATKYVAVHLHSQRVKLDGGVVVDMTAVDEKETADWLELTGATVADGKIRVYKAVDDNLTSYHGGVYPIGQTVTDPEWTDDHACGGGLHFSPSPAQAHDHFEQATRYLACDVELAAARCIDVTKLKAPACAVMFEVDIHGRPVA